MFAVVEACWEEAAIRFLLRDERLWYTQMIFLGILKLIRAGEARMAGWGWDLVLTPMRCCPVVPTAIVGWDVGYIPSQDCTLVPALSKQVVAALLTGWVAGCAVNIERAGWERCFLRCEGVLLVGWPRFLCLSPG